MKYSKSDMALIKKFNDFKKRYNESFRERIDTSTKYDNESEYKGSQTISDFDYSIHPNFWNEFDRRERRILMRLGIVNYKDCE